MFDTYRTHGAGTLRREHDSQEVLLAGWVARRRDHGGVAFVDLRDTTGVVQVVADPSAGAALEAAHDLRSEYVVRVRGAVRVRPQGMENPNLPTGAIEVAASSVEVLSSADTPPFPIEERVDVDENLRLAYRYLDLRRPPMAAAIKLRSRVTRVIRRVMEAYGFLEIETPILTRSTPEGARDFLVPSRFQPGSVYALPQSPQLFKQLLMVAGLDRYYQIARCFRDEDFRADRQPEFTQLDVEASFVVEQDLYSMVEDLLGTLWREVLGQEIPTPFPRLPYREAMRRYGSDKPDTRFGLELIDLNQTFSATEVGVFKGALDAGGSVLAIRLPGGGDMSRKQLDDLQDWAKGRGAKGLAWAIVEQAELRSPLTKFMAEAEVEGLLAATQAQPGDALFFAAGETRFAQELLGGLRNHLARERGLIEPGTWDFLWITEPPVVEWNADEERWDAVHHPFTAPTDASLELLESDPGAATARAYDVVLNGVEIGGGSIRIHRRDVQSRVFRVLGISEEEAEAKFGFLLKGLSYGAPPHGGIAFGLDRLIMLMGGLSSIRDVMAFPKTASGTDPMTGAPSPVEPAQLRDVGMRLLPPAAKG